MTTTAAAEQKASLDVAYARLATYRLFERWSRGLQIESAAEGPLDGAAGVAGVHLLGLARQGVRVKALLPDDEALARVRAIYRREGVEARLTTGRLSADAIPAGPLDVLVSFDALRLVSDWRAYLASLFRADARWFFVVATNLESYGTSLRWATGGAGSAPVRREELEQELERAGRILSHDYFDCPWWPSRSGAPGSRGAGEVEATERFGFFEGAPGFEALRRALRLHPVFDRAPARLTRAFGHLHGYLVAKR